MNRDRDEVVRELLDEWFLHTQGEPWQVRDMVERAFDAGLAAGAAEEREAVVEFVGAAIDCDSEECESCGIYSDMHDHLERGTHRTPQVDASPERRRGGGDR